MPPEPTRLDRYERLARLALYLGLKTSAGAFHRVIRHVGSASAAFEERDLTVLRVNLTPLLSAGLFEEAQDKLDKARAAGLGLLIWGDPDYPERLEEIPDPPPALWFKGSLEPGDRHAVGLVGSREASASGLRSAHRLAAEGAEMGLTIVSGLAKGIDAQAHYGALAAGGRTLAVLGNGLDHVYPAENARLYEKIAQSGALISEFPPEVKPLPGNFPRRNRVIAGLSLAVVVVEAGLRSGALITARLALEMNREVMALPGPAGEAHAQGANNLIKNGAALVENMREVLAEIRPRLLEGLARPGAAPETAPETAPERPVGNDKAESLPKRVRTPQNKVAAPPRITREKDHEPPLKAAGQPRNPGPAILEPAPEPPDGPEALILGQLTLGPQDSDQLTRATGLGVAEMSLALLRLELRGLVARLESGLYGAPGR